MLVEGSSCALSQAETKLHGARIDEIISPDRIDFRNNSTYG